VIAKSGGAAARKTMILSSNAYVMWPYKVHTAADPSRCSDFLQSSLLLILQETMAIKIVLGAQSGKGVWTGPKSPNSTKVVDNNPGCGNGNNTAAPDPESGPGCLFDLSKDPTEHVDLARTQPALFQQVWAAWQADQVTKPYYQTNDTPGYTNCININLYVQKHSNFGGPICYCDNCSIPWLELGIAPPQERQQQQQQQQQQRVSSTSAAGSK